jgi:hypothetical protein
MKRNSLLVTIAVGLLCIAAAAEPIEVPVTVTTADQAKLGVETAVLESRTVRLSITAIVRSIDPLPLAALNSDLAAATAAAAASDSELRRVAGLAAQDRSASQQALEAARARAAADRAAVTLLQRRLELEWGTAFAAQDDQARDRLVRDVSSGTAALLRADALERSEGVEGRVTVEIADGVEIATSELLGLSGSADPRMQTIGLFCVVRGDGARMLRPGRVLGGRIETGEPATGVVLPRSALIRTEGSVWAYVRTGAQDFMRREIAGGQPVVDGWFVTDGFDPGTEIVANGAGSMIAIERADEMVEED